MDTETELERMLALAERHNIEVWQEDCAECPDCHVVMPASHEMEHDYGCPHNNAPVMTNDPKWWWWTCSPGCLPESEAMGPYDTTLEALDAATDGLED